MTSIFLAGLRTSPAPWFTKRGGAPNNPTDTVHDQTGREIARITHPGGADYTADQYRANLALITHAPQLLAALTEYAFLLDSAGTGPDAKLADLIYNSGGVDIRNRVRVDDNG